MLTDLLAVFVIVGLAYVGLRCAEGRAADCRFGGQAPPARTSFGSPAEAAGPSEPV